MSAGGHERGAPLRPRTGQEAAALLRAAGGAGRRVSPRGGGTKPWGPPDDGEVLDTRGLDRIVEHNAGDFTAVLEAGVPLAVAQARFAEHGQMLALDPPLGSGDAATIGGVLATADSGPLRHRYGAPRDLVLGATVALSDGTLARSGGRVIKNVAGYDLAKLFCGSFGTLGLIVQVAVRLHPRARATATVVGASDDPDRLGATAAALAGRPLEADCLDVHWRDGAGQLLVRFAGATAARRAAALAETLELGEPQVVEDDDRLWDEQRGRQRTAEPGTSGGAGAACVLKVSGRITDLPAMCRTGAEVVGRAGLGLYWLRTEPDRVAPIRAALAPRACTLLDAPEELRAGAWAQPDPGALALMARLKQRFDPARAFRPGAFVGGI